MGAWSYGSVLPLGYQLPPHKKNYDHLKNNVISNFIKKSHSHLWPWAKLAVLCSLSGRDFILSLLSITVITANHGCLWVGMYVKDGRGLAMRKGEEFGKIRLSGFMCIRESMYQFGGENVRENWTKRQISMITTQDIWKIQKLN